MTDLNFLPEKQEQRSKKDALFMISKHLSVHLTILVGVIVLLLLGGQYVLDHQLDRWKDQSSLLSQERLLLVDRVSSLNKEVKEINKIQSTYVPWSDVVIAISELVPEGNRVDEFVIRADEGVLLLTGFSEVRNDLLAFEERLGESPFVTHVESPLSNLLDPNDIAYEFTVSLNLDALVEGIQE